LNVPEAYFRSTLTSGLKLSTTAHQGCLDFALSQIFEHYVVDRRLARLMQIGIVGANGLA
jgi:hypothetical protein